MSRSSSYDQRSRITTTMTLFVDFGRHQYCTSSRLNFSSRSSFSLASSSPLLSSSLRCASIRCLSSSSCSIPASSCAHSTYIHHEDVVAAQLAHETEATIPPPSLPPPPRFPCSIFWFEVRCIHSTSFRAASRLFPPSSPGLVSEVQRSLRTG